MSSAEQQRESSNIQVLVDSIPALIHTARPDGYIDYFNKRWLEYFGVTLDEVAGWNWTTVIHAEDVEGILTRWRACLETGEIFEYETRVRGANGEYRWMFHRKVPLHDANGNIVKWYGSSMDIHQRKTAEEALRSSEAYLAKAQRLSQTGSFGWKADTGDIVWSDETYRIFEYDRSVKPTIDSLMQRVHPSDRADFQKVIDGASRGASDFEHTYRLLLPDGRVKHVHAIAHAVQNASGDREFVGAATDITERKAAEETRRRSEEYLAEAQRLTHTGSWVWNVADRSAVHLSEEWYRIYGFNPAEGQPDWERRLERVHPEDRLKWKDTIERAIQEKADYDLEFRIVLPDGVVKWIHTVGHPVLTEAGDLVQFLGSSTDITARKTTEDKFRRLVDAGILGIFIANLEGEIVEANRAFLQMFQYDRQDLLSGRLRWEDMTPVELRERDQRAVTEALAHGFFQPYEKQFFRKDGSRLPVLLGGALFQDSNEGVSFVLDLSEQKRAEEALRSSEAYLAEAQRLSHTGSCAVDGASREIRYWSEEMFRLFGFDPQQGLPTWDQWLERIHPEDRNKFRMAGDRTFFEKVHCDVEFRSVKPDGTVKQIHGIGHPILSPNGELVQVIGTMVDVTERRRAEEKIRQSEKELGQILDLAPQFVAVFGPNRERLYANRVLLDYLGVSLEAWRKISDFDEIVHPDDRERVLDHFDRAYSTGSAFEAEVRLRKGDGSYRWFLGRYSPLHDDKGRITRWFSAATDIDERKRAEQKLQQENVALREEIDKASMFEEIVGTSRALQTVLSRISKVAPSDSTVLITGETGTGKELVARAIHRRSDRASRPFVSVNCAATPRDLIASELFGHEKGAFTGATQQRLGRFELANGGTLFLDEVGELPAETQIALLRVLQEHEFERVGGTRPIRADVRVIAATNRDLQAAISAGSFRSDLFYRLHVFPIEIPALRERKEDIPLLVEYFIDRYARKAGKNIKSIDKKTLQLLQSYPWPGNIRELQNVIERSVIVSETATFSVDESWLSRQPIATEPSKEVALFKRLPSREKAIIEGALRESGGRVSGPSGAAVKLGIPGSTLDSKIRSLKIDKNRFKVTAPSKDQI